jgi:succinate-semialdehyde dehydrogenase/glutarate-semialdehyde dehydrogenase
VAKVEGMIVDGAEVGSASGEWFSVYDPATGEEVGRVASGGEAEVEEAVESSYRALAEWRETPAVGRALLISSWAGQIRAKSEELGCLLTREQGRPLGEAKAEVESAARLLDYYAAEARRIEGWIPPVDHKERICLVFKEPVGVVAAITPWNFPLALLARIVGPALAAGCTVVGKPASDTPLTTLRIAQLALESSLPPGVFNVVTGSGAEVGEALVEHPMVRKIGFTGSREIGKRIMELASRGLKRVTLELGGQCPAIVWEDANLDIAVDALTFQAYRQTGQVCNRVNRIYAHRTIAEELTERLVDKAKKIVVGNGFKEGVDIGPIINERQLKHVHSHVEDAVAKGAKVLCGGSRLTRGECAKGCFYPPTLVENCNHDMLLMTEETFGPVVGMMKVDDWEETIDLANDSVYGLSAFVFTEDHRRAMWAARRLECGSVWVNDIHWTYHSCPYGGMKESGMGREQSPVAVDEYLELKAVYYDLARENRGGYACVHP